MTIFGQTFVGVLEALVYGIAITFVCSIALVSFKAYETAYMPVITDMEIQYSGTDDFSDHYTSVDLKFNKQRSCTPVVQDFAWYVITPDGAERVFFKLPRITEHASNVTRPLGMNISKNWLVDFYQDVSHTQETYSRLPQKIVFYHNCFWLWKTKTEIDVPKIKPFNVGAIGND